MFLVCQPAAEASIKCVCVSVYDTVIGVLVCDKHVYTIYLTVPNTTTLETQPNQTPNTNERNDRDRPNKTAHPVRGHRIRTTQFIQRPTSIVATDEDASSAADGGGRRRPSNRRRSAAVVWI